MIRRKRGSSGFTLIEMLAVMAIMLILMTIAMVGFYEWSGSAASRGALLDVKSNLVNARQWAITKRHKTSFVFGNAELAGSVRGYFSLTNAEDGAIGNTNYLPTGVAFSNVDGRAMSPGGTNTIVFSIEGTLSGRVPDTNLVIVGKGTVNTVKVYSLTGRARLMH